MRLASLLGSVCAGLICFAALPGCAKNDYWSSGRRAAALAQALDGYAWAQGVFIFEDQKIYPKVVGEPEFLELRLRMRRPATIDSVLWRDPLDARSRPTVDWNGFRSLFDAASKRVSRHRWLWQWREAAKGRRVELEVRGRESADIVPEISNRAFRPWRRASFQGKPQFFVTASNERSNHDLSIAFGEQDDRALVYYTATRDEPKYRGHYPILHPLDAISLEPWASEGSGSIHEQYAVIMPSGKFHVRTYTMPVGR
jgi:hypothetical protein